MNRSKIARPWHQIPSAWEGDEDLVGLPDNAVLLFLKLVTLAHTAGSGGRLTAGQVLMKARTVRRGRQAVDALMARGCITAGPSIADVRDADGLSKAPVTTPVGIAKASQWFLYEQPSPSIPAAKPRSGSAKSEQTPTRAPARITTDRQEEPIRSPSGSDRIGSARAAPRSAGGAARPAPMEEPGDTVGDDDLSRMTPDEKKQYIRQQIRNGQANSPHCTGRDTVFSRWDPNRTIVPLKSGFSINGDEQ